MKRRLVLVAIMAVVALSCVDEGKVREAESRAAATEAKCSAKIRELETGTALHKKEAYFWRMTTRVVHLLSLAGNDPEKNARLDREAATAIEVLGEHFKELMTAKVLEPDDAKVYLATLNWVLKLARRGETEGSGRPGTAAKPSTATAEGGSVSSKSADDVYAAVKLAADEKRWDQVEPLVREMQSKYPSHKLLKKAEKILKKAQAEMKKAATKSEREKKEREIEERLANVSVQEIYANMREYSGKTIVRKLECQEPRANFMFKYERARSPFKMVCWPSGGSITRDWIDVGLSESQLKPVAALPRAKHLSLNARLKIVDRKPMGSGIVAKLVDIVENEPPSTDQKEAE